MSHPKGLYLLSLTEMWESFSFYIYSSILVLFMMDVLHFSPDFSAFFYGIIIGLSYIIQIVAGFVCDRFLGNRKSVMIGSILMVIAQLIFTYCASMHYLNANLIIHSNIMFTFPEILFLAGISLMTIGVSLFKVSNTSFVSLLYDDDHPEELDSAYSIFYLALGLGGFLATLTVALVLGDGDASLYQYGFLIGFVTILIGLITFFGFKNRYLKTENGEYIGVVPVSKISKDIGQKTNERLSKIEIKHLGILSLILIFVFVFFMGHEQIFTSMIFFTLDYVNNFVPVLNMEIHPTFYLTINTIFILVLGPILLKVYGILARRNKEPSSITKIIIGLFSLAVAFLILMISLSTFDGNMQISMVWMIFFNLFIVISEFLILPSTLSLISRLSPQKYVTLMFGAYYTTLGIGEMVSGTFAAAFPGEGPTTLLGFIPITDLFSFFSVFAILGLVLGVILLLSRGRLEKMINTTD